MWSRSLFSAGFRQAARPMAMRSSAAMRPAPFLSAFQSRLLSDTTRQAIEKAVGSAPVVLFMKGTPETPQVRLLPRQHPDPRPPGRRPQQVRRLQRARGRRVAIRNQRVLRLADNSPAVPREGVRGWMRPPGLHAPGRLVSQDAGGQGRPCPPGGRRVRVQINVGLTNESETMILWHGGRADDCTSSR
ncbi:monothiol glutaredoxin grx5 [Apiospora arundinis]